MRWGGNKITDHNRSELSLDVERIEKSSRMANGTLRRYVIADKKTFSCSWDMLPARARFTVDGNWGALEMEQFYETVKNGFNLELNYASQEPENYHVLFDSFGSRLVKRGVYDFYEVSVTLVEV
jgi:hypothetical protein